MTTEDDATQTAVLTMHVLAPDTDEYARLKSRLQQHLGDGLLLVIGSGLSVAEGLPSMVDLASHLLDVVGPAITSPDQSAWDTIAMELTAGTDLETALSACNVSSNLHDLLIRETANLLYNSELASFGNLLNGNNVLRFAKLLPHLMVPREGIPIVTTNYDRLIEFAAESIGFGVDTLFVGHVLGKLDADTSHFSFVKGYQLIRKTLRFLYRPRIKLFKPHGSLDWFLRADQPVRIQSKITMPRLMVLPGNDKYRTGYDVPFDVHRARANDSIDRASKFLIIGYGFNDDHLETHLASKIRSGVPTVAITRTLSENGKTLQSMSENFLSIERADSNGATGSLIRDKSGEVFLPQYNWWDLACFVSGVLEP